MSEQITEQVNDSIETQLPIVTYSDVATKRTLRHPAAQIKATLEQAIAQEEAEHAQAHAAWQALLADIQAQIEHAQAHNAANPDDQIDVPELPAEPMIDMAKRRACYEVKNVEVDLELTTEAQDSHIVYDDDALIAYHHPKTIAHSDEHIEAIKRERFKTQRAENVAAITVEVDKMLFDGDELSQSRMTRAIILMSDTDTQLWVLANNEVVEVTREQLKQACVLSAQKQSELWV
ncbi:MULTISPECIES: DUF4376 domain-containing protein [Pseudoalteromonas]|uniref:DUF4376 domain-containing protein n=1 Tax=Pseudoalteromonas amylolytica TaxID=1859457 RepID=A0A1S1MT23_9GAMM|nr:MULTISPECIES: hypothetical protein [Pseudoalteromonas]OHU85538.1 hypothetical protein BFC16_19510 [Pseudoalteromonas sp. JW3]OHU91772.1 hypothetical protein BET10_08205 [Pseudoalteromonas amylolytica]